MVFKIFFNFKSHLKTIFDKPSYYIYIFIALNLSLKSGTKGFTAFIIFIRLLKSFKLFVYNS